MNEVRRVQGLSFDFSISGVIPKARIFASGSRDLRAAPASRVSGKKFQLKLLCTTEVTR